MGIYRKLGVRVEVEGLVLSILRSQRINGSVSVLKGDVFFVSVQNTRSLYTSGSSQAKTLQYKPMSKQ